MGENTSKNSKSDTPESLSIQADAPSVSEELASAKILFQEGLLEEAKRLLHKILMVHAGHSGALALLRTIQDSELSVLFRAAAEPPKKPTTFESPDEVVRRLEKDLGIQIESTRSDLDASVENWRHPEACDAVQAFDLGVAFFEMGCYRDAIRQLSEAVRMIRVTQSSLGDLGVAAAALSAESMIILGEGYAAAAWLTPMLNELDISHEVKIPFFYLMGRAEEQLNHRAEAKAWYQKVLEVDPLYRDASFRIRIK